MRHVRAAAASLPHAPPAASGDSAGPGASSTHVTPTASASRGGTSPGNPDAEFVGQFLPSRNDVPSSPRHAAENGHTFIARTRASHSTQTPRWTQRRLNDWPHAQHGFSPCTGSPGGGHPSRFSSACPLCCHMHNTHTHTHTFHIHTYARTHTKSCYGSHIIRMHWLEKEYHIPLRKPLRLKTARPQPALPPILLP